MRAFKNKSQHIGQLRQAFKDGTNKVQTNIFNLLLDESMNPLPQVGTDQSQEKVCPGQESSPQKEDINTSQGTFPSTAEPCVDQHENVQPKETDTEPVSTKVLIFCNLFIHIFPGIKSRRLWPSTRVSSEQ